MFKLAVRKLKPVVSVPASVVDMVMAPPRAQDVDVPFVRILRPVARVPAVIAVIVTLPHIDVFRWFAFIVHSLPTRTVTACDRVAHIQHTGSHRSYEPPAR